MLGGFITRRSIDSGFHPIHPAWAASIVGIIFASSMLAVSGWTLALASLVGSLPVVIGTVAVHLIVHRDDG